MAIKLEFINLIIPISVVDVKYNGGFKQFKIDYQDILGGRVWYDEHLIRDGAMNAYDMMQLVAYWEGKGVIARITVEGKEHWNELCVIDSVKGLSLPCSWIEFENNTAKYKID